MRRYSTREVAEVLDLQDDRVRRLADAAALEPERSAEGHFRFAFRDLVVLRAAADLERRGLPARRVHAALRALRGRLPADRPLAAVRLDAVGGRVVARDAGAAWDPRSGQLELGLAETRPRAGPVDAAGVAMLPEDRAPDSAAGWHELGCRLEESDPSRAERAYRRATTLDPDLAAAQVNLGRLRHEAGDVDEAERLYRAALRADPDHAVAAFNLGVVMDDGGREGEAVRWYERALELDPDLADAHYNLARLRERLGDRTAVIRHLRRYGELTRPD